MENLVASLRNLTRSAWGIEGIAGKLPSLYHGGGPRCGGTDTRSGACGLSL
jgi:hypothetical protein